MNKNSKIVFQVQSNFYKTVKVKNLEKDFIIEAVKEFLEKKER